MPLSEDIPGAITDRLLAASKEACEEYTECKTILLVGNDDDSVRSLLSLVYSSATDTVVPSFAKGLDDVVAYLQENNQKDMLKRMLVHLMLKMDVCGHNERYSLERESCVCVPGRECIDESLYYVRYRIANHVILIVLLIALLLIPLFTMMRATAARKIN